ncbi:FG-GAP-like repeat-containing protein [Streptomyces sp. BK340]|uniref:FG-GAP-like repeat-containing protein n=1 Tax=Streptomyces sp. BK340 TaxID=2572903 RepID=UPI0011AD976C|nr:FG-GAP-like repeat-containing protein [Streptomyces sp. BK340]TVZ82351.1 FG-GAP repeat protein [Streptomyces sp. BK340]
MRKRPTLLAAALLACGLPPVALAAPAAAAPAKYADDFDGDGYRDYAAFSHGPGSSSRGGGVLVTFGTANGPGTKTQFIDQSSPGVPGTDETDDDFGTVRTAADFNGDGYGDLAVSAPHEDDGSHKDEGAVTVLWGSRTGLSGGTTVPDKGPHGSYDDMGDDTATGDFNGDGRRDLAVVDDGRTYVYRGPIERSGVHGTVSLLDKGSGFHTTALISGRVDGDGKTDLVVIGDVANPSSVGSDAWFVSGGKARLYPGRTLHLESVRSGGGSSARGGDGVVGDFDKDGYGDIAIGTYKADKYKGRVSVWYGSASGPDRSARFTQATTGVADTPEADDGFGASISSGDTNGDGYRDLAVGVYGEKLGSIPYAGGVAVLYGSASGLSGKGSKWFTRSSPGVPGYPQEDDAFGGTVRLRDTDREGMADLYVAGTYGSLMLPGSPAGITIRGATAVDGEIIPGMLQ